MQTTVRFRHAAPRIWYLVMVNYRHAVQLRRSKVSKRKKCRAAQRTMPDVRVLEPERNSDCTRWPGWAGSGPGL